MFFFCRGIAYTQQQDYERALLDFNKTISMNSKFGEAYYWRGLTYRSLFKQKLACADMHSAVELGYKDFNLPDFQDYCSKVYDENVFIPPPPK